MTSSHFETNDTPAKPWTQVVIAIAFLTRLPIPVQRSVPSDTLARASWSFPLVGCLIGAISAFVTIVSLRIGISTDAAVLMGLAAAVLVSGALHEDGLADTADGFGGGATVDDKLAIMKDSRIGTYGVLALIIVLALRVTCTGRIANLGAVSTIEALVSAHALSRAFLPGMMNLLLPARPGGLGASAGRPSQARALAALAIGWIIAIIALGVAAGSIATLVALATVAGLGIASKRQIGGYTGDVLGAAQQLAEVAILLVASLR